MISQHTEDDQPLNKGAPVPTLSPSQGSSGNPGVSNISRNLPFGVIKSDDDWILNGSPIAAANPSGAKPNESSPSSRIVRRVEFAGEEDLKPIFKNIHDAAKLLADSLSSTQVGVTAPEQVMAAAKVLESAFSPYCK